MLFLLFGISTYSHAHCAILGKQGDDSTVPPLLADKIRDNSIAAELVKQLSFEYMRRPAFREELQKVKVK